MRKWLLFLVFSIAGILGAQEVALPSASGFSSAESQLPIYQTNEELDTVSNAPRSTFSLLIELILLIAVLSVGVYGILYLLKKGQKVSRRINNREIDSFRVLVEQSLGQDQSLKVVELYSQIIVLAQSSSNVQFLYEITDSDIKNQVLLDFSKEKGKVLKSENSIFLNYWRDKFQKLARKPTPFKQLIETGDSENETLDKTEFFKDSQERVKNL